MLRTHTCGDLGEPQVGETVTLCGWVDSYRDHGGGLFVDLRDRYGLTQVVFNPPDTPPEFIEASKSLRTEFVIKVTGTVAERPEGMANPKMATGKIELRGTEFELLNSSLTPPVAPSGQDTPSEDLRLKYRYLDLRRPEMQRVLLRRAAMIKSMRDYFADHDFVDVETPILGRSTPEGARDYLVPSRVNQGTFYALPQSPQLYKQILMIAGYDRYVQVARCFRDEDLRADRQPEFTQLDVEMSFIDQDDIIGVIDGLVAKLAKEQLGIDVPTPLPRMTYDEAMERFGHDAPDLRFGLEVVDCSRLAAKSGFGVFSGAVEAGGCVRAINVKQGTKQYSRRGIDALTSYAKEFGAKGLAWFKVEENGELAGAITKFFDAELLAQFAERLGAEAGDLILFAADQFAGTCKVLHALRTKIGKEMQLYQPDAMNFSWIIEFPLFELDDAESTGGVGSTGGKGRWQAMHHPFTAPLAEHLELLDSDPGKCRAQAYDLVINGSEAGGGTIRIHDAAIQQKAFSLLGIDDATQTERFGFLLDALQYGAPPHGGIALGIDRWVMLFSKLDNIRDCIAFPKTQKATDMMTEAPGKVDTKQLKELSIKLDE